MRIAVTIWSSTLGRGLLSISQSPPLDESLRTTDCNKVHTDTHPGLHTRRNRQVHVWNGCGESEMSTEQSTPTRHTAHTTLYLATYIALASCTTIWTFVNLTGTSRKQCPLK